MAALRDRENLCSLAVLPPMRGVKKPDSERIERDAYYTPPELAQAICDALSGGVDGGRFDPHSVLEPSSGGGAFSLAAARTWPTCHIVEVDLARGQDFLSADLRAELVMKHGGFSLVLGNPPYLKAEEFVRAALQCADPENGYVVMLLRLSFLAGSKRVRLYHEHPLRGLMPIANRPSFTGDGKTDAAEYGVFVWQSGFTGFGELLSPLVWR